MQILLAMAASVQILSGLALILLSSGVVAVARPPLGLDAAPWLKIWWTDQTYVLVVLIIGIVGIGLVVRGWAEL